MPVPSDRHALQEQAPSVGVDEPGALGREVVAAVVAAISEEAGRVVTPDEVLAVVRAMAAAGDCADGR